MDRSRPRGFAKVWHLNPCEPGASVKASTVSVTVCSCAPAPRPPSLAFPGLEQPIDPQPIAATLTTMAAIPATFIGCPEHENSAKLPWPKRSNQTIRCLCFSYGTFVRRPHRNAARLDAQGAPPRLRRSAGRGRWLGADVEHPRVTQGGTTWHAAGARGRRGD